LGDVSSDFDWATEELYEQNKLPLAIGDGQTKITGKPTLAKIGSTLHSDTSAMRRRLQPAGAPRRRAGRPCYRVTVANGANSVDDLGVFFSSSGLPIKHVANRRRSSSAPLGKGTGSNHKHHRLPLTIFVQQCSLVDAVSEPHAANR
jgi:hypothetical protein